MKTRRSHQPALIRRTIAYSRVSTEDQAREGVSLDAQEARIAAYSTAMGFDVAEYIRDAGESAKSLKRPGITGILEAVRRGEIERIVVAKLDRLTRSVRDLSDLLELCSKYDVALVSVAETLDTSSAGGRMIVNMLGVISAWEREVIGERTKQALDHKRGQGECYSRTPFGYRREGKTLVADIKEQRALQEAVRMDRAGASYREIARRLTELGIQPKRGERWYASSVRSMLRSRMTTTAMVA